MVFTVGRLPKDLDPASIRYLQHPDQTDEFENGDVIWVWDRLFQWDEDCVPASKLAELASLGDPPVDDFLDSLPPQALADQDLLELVLESARQDGGDSKLAIDLWLEMTREAPEEVRATAGEVERGQRFFFGNVSSIFASLLHFSLAGGFSAPRISRALHQASYLIPPASKATGTYLPITPASSARTMGRLYETSNFVLEAMGLPPPPAHDLATASEKEASERLITFGLPGLSPPPLSSVAARTLDGAGEGWKATCRVRLLHGVVRQRIRSRPSEEDDPSVPPLNQEDMIGTLASFAVAPLLCLEQFGAPPTAQDCVDFLRTWRHIGFYLGIPPSALARHFTHSEPARKFLACVVCHLFPPPSALSSAQLQARDGTLPPPTLPVLLAVANSGGPIKTTLRYHQSMTRALVGDSLADFLDVPRTSFIGGIRLHLSIFAMTFGGHFARVYPSKRWKDLQISIAQEGMGRVIRFGMGRRKPIYRARDEASGDLSEEAMEEERVRLDVEGARKMMRRYTWLVGEMLVVSGAAAALAGGLLWWLTRAAVGALAEAACR